MLNKSNVGQIWNLTPRDIDLLGIEFEGQLFREANELILWNVEISDNDYIFFIDDLEHRIILSKNSPDREKYADLTLFEIFEGLAKEHEESLK